MILDIARRRAALTPGAPAVHWDGRWYDYAEMNGRAERLAGLLAARGIGRDDRVGILAANHIAHLDLVLATAKLGIVYTPFNQRLAPGETREIATYVRPSLLLADSVDMEPAASTGVPVLGLDGYEAALAAAPAAPPPPVLGPEDIQMILFTGGTTGLPKGAMQPYRQGFYNAVNTVLSWGLRDDDCVIQATPAFHAAINAFTVPLYHLGARVVLQRSFEPDEYLRLARETSATVLFLVPAMFKMVADHPDFPRTDLCAVRWAISGGAPCPEPVRQAFRAHGVRFKQGYGLTEAGVNCFSMSLAEAETHPRSVGKAILHSEVVLRRPDGGSCEPGELGELTIRGPHVFSGYFERPEATAEVLRDGWLWTGDLATMDAGGFVEIVGRRKEMYISGGENVFPSEIEKALYEHPGVSECAVVGVPDERWGEVGLALVVPKPIRALEPRELRAFLRERLARYKVPKHIDLATELPKSAAGKILKSQLLQAFLRSREGQATVVHQPAQARPQRVDVGGTRIAYQRAGAGRPVVLVHGNFASRRWWTEQLASPPAGVELVALDLPNFGDSDPLAGAIEIAAYARALGGFMTALGLTAKYEQRPVLVGHSLGGGVVQALAAERPRDFAGMLLVSAPPPAGYHTDEAHYALLESLRGNPEMMRQSLLPTTPTRTPPYFDALVEDALRMQATAFSGNGRALDRMNLTGRGASFVGEVLVLHGAKDVLISRAMAEVTQAAYPHGRLIEWAEVGHAPQVEDPPRFERLLSSFVAGLS